MFYDRFAYLCKQKGVSPSRAALDAGISKSLVTKWKTNSIKIPSPDVIGKLCAYFGLSVSELLGEESKKAPTESGERSVSDEDIKFALFGGDGGKLVHKKQNKNDSSRRTVPIIPPLMEALQRTEHRGKYVVTLTGGWVCTRINEICAANGLPEVGNHGLRHSFASLAYHLQIPEKIAMEIGGWADDGTMHKIYTHLAQKDIAKRAQDFSDFFDPAKKKNVQNGNENGNGN